MLKRKKEREAKIAQENKKEAGERGGWTDLVNKPLVASLPDTLSRYRQHGGGMWMEGWRDSSHREGKGSPGQALITESCRGSGEEWETLAKSGRITSLWMQSSFAGLR